MRYPLSNLSKIHLHEVNSFLRGAVEGHKIVSQSLEHEMSNSRATQEEKIKSELSKEPIIKDQDDFVKSMKTDIELGDSQIQLGALSEGEIIQTSGLEVGRTSVFLGRQGEYDHFKNKNTKKEGKEIPFAETKLSEALDDIVMKKDLNLLGKNIIETVNASTLYEFNQCSEDVNSETIAGSIFVFRDLNKGLHSRFNSPLDKILESGLNINQRVKEIIALGPPSSQKEKVIDSVSLISVPAMGNHRLREIHPNLKKNLSPDLYLFKEENLHQVSYVGPADVVYIPELSFRDKYKEDLFFKEKLHTIPQIIIEAALLKHEKYFFEATYSEVALKYGRTTIHQIKELVPIYNAKPPVVFMDLSGLSTKRISDVAEILRDFFNSKEKQEAYLNSVYKNENFDLRYTNPSLKANLFLSLTQTNGAIFLTNRKKMDFLKQDQKYFLPKDTQIDPDSDDMLKLFEDFMTAKGGNYQHILDLCKLVLLKERLHPSDQRLLDKVLYDFTIYLDEKKITSKMYSEDWFYKMMKHKLNIKKMSSELESYSLKQEGSQVVLQYDLKTSKPYSFASAPPHPDDVD